MSNVKKNILNCGTNLQTMETKFAPAGRSSFYEVLQSNLSLEKITYLNDIFSSQSQTYTA